MPRKRVYVQMATLLWPSVCNGKPPDKVVTFLMAKKSTYTTHENSALLSFSVDVKFGTYGIVTLEA